MNGNSSILPRHRPNNNFSFRWIFVGMPVLMAIQILVNVWMYVQLKEPTVMILPPDPQLLEAVELLQEQIADLTKSVQESPESLPYQHDGEFFPFTMRDSKRLTPVQIPRDFHIFDYVDTTEIKQITSKKMQLWLDGYYLDEAACHRYVILCYKQKILQVFHYLLHNTTSDYFFYMESDNELCVPMKEIRSLAYRHRRYFIGTGIGFSGWIMNRTFVQDFLEAYRPPHVHNNENPDPLGARLLMEKHAWTVTRNYLVSHTLKEGFGAPPLTIGIVNKKTGELVSEDKHLPRCMEPKRNKWPEPNSTSMEDRHGWDYFDYEDCPPDAEIFPCRDDQYVNVTFGVKDLLKPPPQNATNLNSSDSKPQITALRLKATRFQERMHLAALQKVQKEEETKGSYLRQFFGF